MAAVPTLVCVALIAVAALATWRWLSRHDASKLRCRGGAIFYGPGVGADEVRRLRDHLERVGYFHVSQRVVELQREAKIYRLRVPCAGGIAGDEEVVARCGVIAALLADEVFPGEGVEVHLCDDRFRTLNVVPHRGDYGERLRFNAAELFYTSGVSEDEAIRVGTYLMSQGFFNDHPKLAQLNRTGGGFELRLEVREGWASRQDLRDEFRRMGCDLSGDVFGGPLVEVRPCESVRETLHTRVLDRAPAPKGGRNKVFLGPTIVHKPPAGSAPPEGASSQA